MSTKPTDGRIPLEIRRAASLEPTLWKNGKGTTLEIAVCPEDASIDNFVWRASMAEIASDGDFSHFPGVDRTIILLGGAGMELDFMPPKAAQVQVALREPFAPFDFKGETPLKATLYDGPTHDFNLMVRRDQAAGEVRVWHGSETFALPDDLVLLFVVRGTVAMKGADAADPTPIYLDPCDSVRLNHVSKDGLSIDLPAGAIVLAVRVRLREAEAMPAS